MNVAIIVAAGRGTRMGPNVDKLFLEIAGRPLVAYTWSRFDSSPSIARTIVVVRGGMEEAFRELAAGLNLQKPFEILPGGRERQDSVWNGLEAVPPSAEIVAIQDGARPCTTEETIAATIQAARETGAAVAAQRVTDTIKEADDGNLIRRTVDRSRLWSVQTPQCFRPEIIRKALEVVRKGDTLVTDDTAACERIGQPVRLVECQTPNPKATSRADLPYLELLLRRGQETQGA